MLIHDSVNFVGNFFLYLRGIFSLYSTRYYKRSIGTLVNANNMARNDGHACAQRLVNKQQFYQTFQHETLDRYYIGSGIMAKEKLPNLLFKPLKYQGS